MASLALFAIGSAVGGAIAGPGALIGGLTGAAIGGFVGGSIGAYIDSTYLFPALFGKDDIVGQRLGDQPLMTGQEGSSLPWILGPLNRVGSTVIWKSDIIEVKKTQKVGKGGGSSVSSYEYFIDIAVAFADTTDLPGNAIQRVVKVYADTKLIYDGTNEFHDKYDSITIYDGSQTTTDPLIVSYKGEAATPTFFRTAYLVINRLRLADYGNRPPNINVVVEQSNPFTLQEAISLIMQRAGYATSEFDVSRLDQCVNGYVISGPQEMSKALAPLLLTYGVNVQEKDQVIHFVSKGDEDQIIIDDAGELAAHDPGSDTPRPLDTIDVDDFDVPSEVAVSFSDASRDLEGGTQRQPRWDHPFNRVNLNLPVTLEPDEALNVAKRYLWSAEAERQRALLTLPPKYISLREGMSLLVPSIDGQDREIWVRRVAIGNNYQIEVEGTFYEPDVFDVTSSLDEADDDDGTYTAPATIAVIADMPTLSTDQEDKIGLYFAACAEDPSAAWRGAELWRADNDLDYNIAANVPAEAVIGKTLGGYISPDVDHVRWDRVSSITVQVYESGLESASEADVLDGVNRAAILSETGEFEIIAFATATLVDTRTYVISDLLRGQRGTAHLIRRHGGFGKRFVLGETVPINFIERPFGGNSYWKVPSVGGALGDFDAQQVLVQGISLRPFSPTAIRGGFDESSGDLVIEWDRRMKYLRGLFSAKTLPLDETPETYEVDIIKGSDPDYGEVVRTIEVQGQTTLTYDDTSIGDDGLSTKPIGVAVHQISHTVGRSPPGFRIFYRQG